VSAERHDVIVVGAGIAGLAAAWELRDRDVLVLEREDRIGGRIWSERRGDYWLNFGAHVFGLPESATGRLLADAGVRAVQVSGRLTAASLNGKIVASGPVASFPLRLPMPVRSRLALVGAGTKLRRAVRQYSLIAAPRPGEEAAVRQARTLAFLDDRSFAEFIGPLPEDVDALFRSTLTRSSGEPEDLAAGYGIGYFHPRLEPLGRAVSQHHRRLDPWPRSISRGTTWGRGTRRLPCRPRRARQLTSVLGSAPSRRRFRANRARAA
jgi:protoporphyrinogen/coproporphyrinogen III oxidase